MSVFSRSSQRKAGNAAIMFALTMVPVIAAVGTAIDYSHVLTVRNRLAAALDAGVVQVGNRARSSQSESLAILKAWVDQHMVGTGASWSVDSVTEDNAGTIAASASGKVKTTIARLLGIDEVPIGVKSR